MSRPKKDQTWLQVAKQLASQATCARRQVGCVLIDVRGHIAGTGWNGVPRGEVHCIDQPCAGASAPSGTALDACEAVHAEMNALSQVRNEHEIETCYCTTAPCLACVKSLMNTSCRRIVFLETYPHAEASKERWLRSNNDGVFGEAQREWFHSLDISERVPDYQDGYLDSLLDVSKEFNLDVNMEMWDAPVDLGVTPLQDVTNELKSLMNSGV